ncbi:MAG: SEC-C domain-containing protein [Sedimentisphaerales bacterium]|nr:SEC-C domain-containing protein [Sedimentisphaerales bacterium]
MTSNIIQNQNEIHRLGRNDPCWCGSGEKYKKCHLNRESQQPYKMSDIVEFQKKFSDKKYCMHPEANDENCKGDICKAHSVQRALLDKIAENSHVFGWNLDMLENTSDSKPRSIGINEASIFTGFCNYHDTKIFEPIEKKGSSE